MTRVRGVSLAEVIIGAFLAGLLMTSVYSLFTAGSRMYMRGQARADLQAAGLIDCTTMSGEMRKSSLSTLTICASSNDGVTALAFRMPNAEAAITAVFVPQSWFVVYFHDSVRRRLVRKTWGDVAGDPVALAPSPFAEGRRLTPEELYRVALTPNGTERVIDDSVVRLGIQPERYPDVTVRDVRVTLELNLQKHVLGQTYEQTVSTAVSMRNRL